MNNEFWCVWIEYLDTDEIFPNFAPDLKASRYSRYIKVDDKRRVSIFYDLYISIWHYGACE